MATNKQEIIDSFKEHIKKGGGGFGDWYVGISRNARDRLFNQHKVQENGDWWLYRTAESSQIARDIEYYFINICHTDGGSGGGDDICNMVYAYKKAYHTEP